MTDPSELRSNILDLLKATTEVTNVISGEANIIEYVEEDNGDLIASILELTPPKIMVVYRGTRWTGSRINAWAVDFSFILRCGRTLSPTAVFAAIINGTPTGGGGLPLLNVSIHNNYHPASSISMGRSIIQVGDQSVREYWDISVTYTSRGIDA